MRSTLAKSMLLLGTSMILLWPPLPACLAGSGDQVLLPSYNRKKMKNGIIADLDWRWTNGFGYRPVRVSLSVARANRDRTIRVVLLPESRQKTFGRDPMSVSVDVEIPQGEKEVTKTVNVPQNNPWGVFRAEFFENGRRLNDLSMDFGFSSNRGQNALDAPNILMVNSAAPSLSDDRTAIVRSLRKAKADTQDLPDAVKLRFTAHNHFQRTTTVQPENFEDEERSNDSESLDFVLDAPNLEMLPPDDLPRDHVGLTGIDLIVISVAELADIAQDKSDRFRAIDYYVRNGGNLIVFDESDVKNKVASLFSREYAWRKADEFNFPAKPKASFQQMVQEPNRKSRGKVPDGLPELAQAAHGFGQVAAIHAADPYAQSTGYWQWTLKNIGLNRLTWSERHGISMIQNNDDYWDFLIPGYGASPVRPFLGVITIFILCVGPLNFYVLNRAKRLYLLPITIGLAAFFTTIAMLAYALVSDGISTRVRLRSFTKLDQRADETIASTYCRQSYLAAFTPSDGLVFPSHTCVYPIIPQYNSSLEREETVRTRTDKRILGRGYMRARTTMQFLTTDVQTTKSGIDLSQGMLTSTNKMGVALSHAWAHNEAGVLFQALDVKPDEKMNFVPVDPKKARLLFTNLSVANKPAPPEGLDKSANDWMFGSGYTRYSYARSRPVYAETSLLTSNMKDISDFFNNGRPNTFLAVSKNAPPFVHRGTKAREEAGFHVFQGDW